LKEYDIQTIVERVGWLIQQFFNQMIGHGDTKASNFLVTQENVQIMDLDVMKKYKSNWVFHKAFKRDCKRFMKNWKDNPDISKTFQQMLSRIHT
jgi:tRNA A-37 threonylcarbamoyl transferase component Bud32